jgi:1-deoxy-D-xylulose-5-phosphate synthase
MDVALHKAGVTIVLDRSGITGEDGASHNGMWDLAMLGIVPGLHLAAPRDEPTLRRALREAVAIEDRPSVVRYPKTALGSDVPAVRVVGDVDVLGEPDESGVDILLVSVGAMAQDVLTAARGVNEAGYRVRVVDALWVTPISPALIELAADAEVVITVEDGIVVNGVGARLAQRLGEAGSSVPTRNFGVPVEFLDHGKVADVKARIGLTPQGIARRTVEFAAGIIGRSDVGSEGVTGEHPLTARADQQQE